MKDLYIAAINWVREDYRSNPIRCVLEIIAWLMSITGSIIMMLTLPHPPFFFLYPWFIVQCSIFAYYAKSRKSLGLFANYLLLVTIDSIALIRYIFISI